MKTTIVALSVMYISSLGCVSQTAFLPPPPPEYVYDNEPQENVRLNQGSIWSQGSSLFEDRKAKRVNDLVTVEVVENVTGSKKAETNTSKNSSYAAALTDFFGAPSSFNFDNFWGRGNAFSPTIEGSSASDFKGNGETNREGNLSGTITAKVVEVQPNGNLIIESRKEITLNKETQILILRGIIRPDDVAYDNTISSTKVADAKLYFVGKGLVSEKQSPGWMSRILGYIWPF